MKRLLTMSFSILVLTLTGTLILAQPGPGFGGPPPRDAMFGGPQLGRLLHDLDLTDSQQSSIQDIMQTSRENFRTLADALRESRQSLDSAMLDGVFDTDALAQVESNEKALTEAKAQLQFQIYSLLTDDQRASLRARLSEAPQGRSGPERGPDW